MSKLSDTLLLVINFIVELAEGKDYFLILFMNLFHNNINSC